MNTVDSQAARHISLEDCKRQLKRQLVVSCQPVDGGPMDRPDIVAAFARAALAGGAAAVRIEGVENVKAVRQASDALIVGLVKHDLCDSPVRITPHLDDVRKLAASGADIIAYDATDRPRPFPTTELVAEIHKYGKLPMADCSTPDDVLRAAKEGVDIVGTTLSGYTGDTEPVDPDIEFVQKIASWGVFVIAEGRYRTLGHVTHAIDAGADCITVGSAITRVEHITGWFTSAIHNHE